MSSLHIPAISLYTFTVDGEERSPAGRSTSCGLVRVSSLGRELISDRSSSLPSSIPIQHTDAYHVISHAYRALSFKHEDSSY